MVRDCGSRNFGFRDCGLRDCGFRDCGFSDCGFRDCGCRNVGFRNFGFRDCGFRELRLEHKLAVWQLAFYKTFGIRKGCEISCPPRIHFGIAFYDRYFATCDAQEGFVL